MVSVDSALRKLDWGESRSGGSLKGHVKGGVLFIFKEGLKRQKLER